MKPWKSSSATSEPRNAYPYFAQARHRGLQAIIVERSERGHPYSTTQETWVALCVRLIRPGGVAQP